MAQWRKIGVLRHLLHHPAESAASFDVATMRRLSAPPFTPPLSGRDGPDSDFDDRSRFSVAIKLFSFVKGL